MVFSKRWRRFWRLMKLDIKIQTQFNVTLFFGGAANENSANFN